MKKLLIVALLLGSAFAQETRFHALASAEVASGGGAYVTPRVRLSFEPEFFAGPRWGFAGFVGVIPTGKADTRDGGTVSNRAEIWRDVSAFRLGAGESYSFTWTSKYQKSALHPYALAAVRVRDCCTISQRFFLPFGDRRNGLLGPEIFAGFPLRRRFGWRVSIAVFSSYPTDNPQLGRATWATAGAGITWVVR